MSVTLTIPPYWELYIYSSVGALLLWTKLTMQKRKLQSLSEIFQEIFPNSQRLQNLSQFAFFVLFGGFIGILAVGPYTQLQALAGGVAWSRLSARD